MDCKCSPLTYFRLVPLRLRERVGRDAAIVSLELFQFGCFSYFEFGQLGSELGMCIRTSISSVALGQICSDTAVLRSLSLLYTSCPLPML